MLRPLGGVQRCPPALGPPLDEVLRHRRGQPREEPRALRIVHRRVPHVVADRARPRGVEDQRRIQRGAGLNQAVVETAYRVRSRIESVEPAPEPPAVFERTQLRRLRQVKSRRGKLSEDVDVLDRVNTGERRLDAGGGVLVHEDGKAASVRARAGTTGRLGAHRDIELDSIDPRVREGVDLGLRSLRIEPPAEPGEARVRIALLQHRSGEEDPRARPGSRLDHPAVRRDVVELATEIEHRGDAGGEEQLGMPLVRRVDVYVHVDEAGSEELASGVDHRRAGWDRRRRGGPDPGHPVAVDHDVHWLRLVAPRSVDEGAANDRDHAFRNTPRTLCFLDIYGIEPECYPLGYPQR